MSLFKKQASIAVLMVAVILVGFLSLVGLFGYFDMQNRKLLDKKAEAIAMIDLWGKLQKNTTSLLLADDLDGAIEAWRKTISEFDQAINAFIGSKIIQDLMRNNSDFVKKIKETENLWRRIKPRIEYVHPRLLEYLERDAEDPRSIRRSLLHELLYQVEQRERSLHYLVLFDLTYDIEYMISSLNDYFVSVLNGTVEFISRTIDRKSYRARRFVQVSSLIIVLLTVCFIVITRRTLDKKEHRLQFLSAQLIYTEEKERKRIAGELHDEVGQALTAIKFGVENALTAISRKEITSGISVLQNLVNTIQNAVQETRRISVSLHPAIIDQLGILATISWYCREYGKIYTAIDLEQKISVAEEDVPDRLKTVIYRVLQEALSNCAKHSHGHRVSVTLAKKRATITLKISDDGKGFNPADVSYTVDRASGFGIVSMRERVELAGGTFSIVSRDGRGTLIRAAWPV